MDKKSVTTDDTSQEMRNIFSFLFPSFWLSKTTEILGYHVVICFQHIFSSQINIFAFFSSADPVPHAFLMLSNGPQSRIIIISLMFLLGLGKGLKLWENVGGKGVVFLLGASLPHSMLLFWK